MEKLFVCLVSILISSALFSQQSDSIYHLRRIDLGNIKTTISHEEIERNYAKSLSQLLNEQAGFVVNGAYQPLGSFINIYSEGALGAKILILIDGQPVWDPSSISNAYFDLNFISLDEIEEINLYKPGQGANLGDGAMMGSIDIITRKGYSSKSINLKVRKGIGNLNTSNSALQFWGTKNKFNYQASFSTASTDGFSIAQDTTGTGGFDIDGFRNSVFNSRIEYTPNHNLLLYGYCLYSKYKASTDIEGFVDAKDYFYTNKLVNTGIGGAYVLNKTQIFFDYKFSNTIRDYHYASYDQQHWGGLANFVKIETRTALSKQCRFSAGIDYRDNQMKYFTYDTLNGDTYKHFPSFYQYGVFTGIDYQTKDNSLSFHIKGRLNNHSSGGMDNAYSIYGNYRLNKHFNLFSSIATGFLTPTIFELLYTDIGNNQLAAERSSTFDFGIEYNTDNIQNRLHLLHNNLSSMVNFDFQSGTFDNCDKLNVTGVEYEFNTNLSKHLQIKGNYTYMSGNEQSPSRQNTWDIVTYDYLVRRPKNIVNLNITYHDNKQYSITINGKYVSTAYDVGAASDDIIMKEYFLLNLNASLHIYKGLSANLGIQNLLNTTFYDTRGFNSIPLLANGCLSYTF